ncbi:MAG: GNAT family N-acetyltransferase, partial [Bryobacteraceae bacterium]
MIRSLTAADIPQALELSSIAGWNQTAEDWLMLINLAPESCFAFECDGEIAATTTLICYERRLAWIGMVLTRPPYRRRGFAHALVTHALETADRGGIETVKLDATDQGQPLYESLGFIAEQEVERWSGNGGRPSPPACTEPARFPESFAALDL